jgi:hypothetical protein
MNEQSEHRNLPVVSEVPEARVIERPPEQMTLSAPVAAATGGVLAGIATFALVRVLRHGLRRKPSIKLGKRRRSTKLEIAGSRSFLVDVHVLNKR